MTYPELNSEGYWCGTCGIHRTRTAQGLCPSCDDDAKVAARPVWERLARTIPTAKEEAS